MPARVRLGELLVEAGIITRDQLEVALERQRDDGRRLGTLLVDEGMVSETQVTQILSQQLSVPWVSLYKVEFTRDLLQLVSQELVEKHCLVPLFVRRVRGQGNTLYVAMDDPTNASASEEVEAYCGLSVRTMIASPTDIRSAIRVYYGEASESPSLAEAEWELGLGDYEAEAADEAEKIDVEPDEAQVADQAEEIDAEPDETEAEDEAEDEAAAPASQPSTEAPEIEFKEVELDAEGEKVAARSAALAQARREGAQRLIRLTLLDGTTVALPAPAGAPLGAEADDEGTRWTARDLVAALRAAARGGDMAKKLGEDVKWEAAFAALLAVLLKKHLIADWEFVEEFKKARKRKGKSAGKAAKGEAKPDDQPAREEPAD